MQTPDDAREDVYFGMERFLEDVARSQKGKRKASLGDDDRSTPPPHPALWRLRGRLLTPASSTSSSGDDSNDGVEDYCDVSEHPPPGIYEAWREIPVRLGDVKIQFPTLAGWSPSTVTLPSPRPFTLSDARNRELLREFIDYSAKGLADCCPTYIDLYRKEIPAMAYKSEGLLQAVLALSAVQLGLRQKNEKIMAEAVGHYHAALLAHVRAVQDPESVHKDFLVATSIILAYYEIWQGENIKMGVHMLGARDMIVARGKSAHLSPVGRALYASFKRIDIVTSWISGNPTFMTHDWWMLDPFARIPILDDSPILLASDAALAKISIICCKLALLKAWAIRRRRDFWQSSTEKRALVGQRIAFRVAALEDDLENWKRELPAWYAALPEEPTTGENGEEEDINTTSIMSILPRRYPHSSIALVHGWAIGVAVQLFRIKHPDAPVVPPKIGGLCHALLRIFAFLPSSADGSIIAPLFAIGLELRQAPHQHWLSSLLQKRLDETSFHGIAFLRDGLRFAWLKISGVIPSGRFNRIKEGAASQIEGVSENLWAAEGMLATFEKLSLYDSPDIAGTRKNFRGEVDWKGLDEDVPLEVALERERKRDRGEGDVARGRSDEAREVKEEDDEGQ